MENFVLWSISFDEQGRDLSFFVYPVHVQRMNHGTREMIRQMLNDLGAPTATFNKWTVHHFITDYFTDHPESNDWEANCGDVWEIIVELVEPVTLTVRDAGLIPTWAMDETWQGKPMPYLLPSEFVVVADFYSTDSVRRAQETLEAVGKLEDDPSHVANRSSRVAEVSNELFLKLCEAYRGQTTAYEAAMPVLSLRRRKRLPRQLIVSLGTFDEKTFSEGAKIAGLVSNLCRTLGGTTTWRERTSPERHD